ncbi:MAG: FMN-binding glutamate synthase family protein [Acidimicrobiales bacterium]
MTWLFVLAAVLAILVVLAVIDVIQTRHAIRRNYPVIGRLRYALERLGPELRQYIVTDNDEERPFSRDQRRWVYTSAKLENQYFGFGTDNKMTAPLYPIFRQSAFPYSPAADRRLDTGQSLDAGASPETADRAANYLPPTKILGEWRDRPGAFRPQSMVAISAMSFGSLSGRAIESLNRGAAIAGCLHNTGEGGVSAHHLHGGELIFQLGTGYFGARTPGGGFDLDAAIALVDRSPIRAIEVKLSQGAKPGLGGVLPAAKVTAEIAAARGVPVGVTVASPARHAEFGTVAEMIDFVERIADACRVPVGIKSAVGDLSFWVELAEEMASTGRGPDFISIDGGEGGTGAAPLVFSDHVSLPFRFGFAEVYRIFAERSMHDKVMWFGAGRLGFPGEAMVAVALGADMIYVAREAMMAIGCIQAQECHTGHCPTGVATHSKWLTRGLDPTDKSARAANYLMSFRGELIKLAHAFGKPHPALVSGRAVDLMMDGESITSLWDHFNYRDEWQAVPDEHESYMAKLMS